MVSATLVILLLTKLSAFSMLLHAQLIAVLKIKILKAKKKAHFILKLKSVVITNLKKRLLKKASKSVKTFFKKVNKFTEIINLMEFPEKIIKLSAHLI